MATSITGESAPGPFQRTHAPGQGMVGQGLAGQGLAQQRAQGLLLLWLPALLIALVWVLPLAHRVMGGLLVPPEALFSDPFMASSSLGSALRSFGASAALAMAMAVGAVLLGLPLSLAMNRAGVFLRGVLTAALLALAGAGAALLSLDGSAPPLLRDPWLAWAVLAVVLVPLAALILRYGRGRAAPALGATIPEDWAAREGGARKTGLGAAAQVCLLACFAASLQMQDWFAVALGIGSQSNPAPAISSLPFAQRMPALALWHGLSALAVLLVLWRLWTSWQARGMARAFLSGASSERTRSALRWQGLGVVLGTLLAVAALVLFVLGYGAGSEVGFFLSWQLGALLLWPSLLIVVLVAALGIGAAFGIARLGSNAPGLPLAILASAGLSPIVQLDVYSLLGEGISPREGLPLWAFVLIMSLIVALSAIPLVVALWTPSLIGHDPSRYQAARLSGASRVTGAWLCYGWAVPKLVLSLLVVVLVFLLFARIA
ncbi:MAG: hypothetical protein MRY63_07790 [Neomegalonema sp.]|nr:hypothetical protein [Neomegalonema sp.]